MSARIRNLFLDQPAAALVVWDDGTMNIDDSSGRSYTTNPLVATILLAMPTGSRLKDLYLGNNSLVANIVVYQFEGMPRYRFELFSPTERDSHTILVVNRSDIVRALVTIIEP